MQTLSPNRPATILLPWAPSANRIWRSSRGCFKPYFSKPYEKFIIEARLWRLRQGNKRIVGTEPLEVVLRLFPPNRRAYDVDNRIKPTLDALTKIGFWIDDKIVRKVTAIAGSPCQGGGIAVEIYRFIPPVEGEPERFGFRSTGGKGGDLRKW